MQAKGGQRPVGAPHCQRSSPGYSDLCMRTNARTTVERANVPIVTRSDWSAKPRTKEKIFGTVEHAMARADRGTYGARYERYANDIVYFPLAMKVLSRVSEKAHTSNSRQCAHDFSLEEVLES